MKFKRYLFLVLGILLLVFFLSNTVYSQSINDIEIEFDKDEYFILEDESIKINYTLFNHGNKDLKLFTYFECDEDLRCDDSRFIDIKKTSQITSSFKVYTEDEGNYDLDFIIKDTNSDQKRSFSVDISSEEDLKDGEFEIDVSNHNLYNNQTNTVYFEIENDYDDGLYNINLTSDVLETGIYKNNPIYLDNGENNLKGYVTLNENTKLSSYNAKITIENQDIKLQKNIKFYFKEKQEDESSFSVNFDLSSNILINKEQKEVYSFDVYNSSNETKQFFIDYNLEADDDIKNLDIDFSTKQFTLNPNKSKNINLEILADKKLHAGTYIINLTVFDYKNQINKKIYLQIKPESDLKTRFVQGNNIPLNIGSPTQLQLVIENKGDLKQDLRFSYELSNGLEIKTKNNRIISLPHRSKMVVFNILATKDTKQKASQIRIKQKNLDTGNIKYYDFKVNAFINKGFLNISYLSYPEKVEVDSNSSKNFVIELYNYSDEAIEISDISLLGIPQNIDYEIISPNKKIPEKSSKAFEISLETKDISAQEINAKIRVSSDSKSLDQPFKISIKEADFKEDQKKDDEKDKTPFTGFFSLSSSILLGIISICVVIILLYLTGAIKHRNRVYN